MHRISTLKDYIDTCTTNNHIPGVKNFREFTVRQETVVGFMS